MIYLASPFTHPSPVVREQRIAAVRDFTAHLLLQRKICVFSPVLYTASIPDAPIPFEAWTHLNDEMIRRCDIFGILDIEGWEESRGIKHEMAIALAFGKPVQMFSYARL